MSFTAENCNKENGNNDANVACEIPVQDKIVRSKIETKGKENCLVKFLLNSKNFKKEGAFDNVSNFRVFLVRYNCEHRAVGMRTPKLEDFARSWSAFLPLSGYLLGAALKSNLPLLSICYFQFPDTLVLQV